MRTSLIVIVAAAALTSATIAAAGSHEKGRDRERQRRAPADPVAESAYRNACGACHTPHAPDLLPPASWRTLLDNLDRHFGQTVELEPSVHATVGRWLAASSPSRRDSSQPATTEALPRITKSAWFERKHRKIGPAVVQRPSVGSMSNCVACHRTAAEWEFDEHRVMIPAR